MNGKNPHISGFAQFKFVFKGQQYSSVVFGRRPCTQGSGVPASSTVFHHPPGPQQEKERGSHRGVFRDQSWEVYSTPPLSTSTTQSSGHVSTPSCKGTCPGLRGTGVCEYIVVFCLPFTRGSALPLTPAQQQALLPYIGFDFFTISSEENILS